MTAVPLTPRAFVTLLLATDFGANHVAARVVLDVSGAASGLGAQAQWGRIGLVLAPGLRRRA